jgi:hypothetical protein
MSSHVKTAAVAALVATLATTATTALAGSGVGGIFNLGQSNTVNATSSLTGTTAGKQLDLQNLSTAASSSALSALGNGAIPAATFQNGGTGPAAALLAGKGQPPFTTNSAYKVVSLNADKLDGLDSSAFTHAGAGSTTILTNRIVVPTDAPVGGMRVLDLPGLGFIFARCGHDPTTHSADLFFENTSGSTLDFWDNAGDGSPYAIFLPNKYGHLVGDYSDKQRGESFGLGFGEQPGFRRTAFVQFYLFQSTAAAPCGVQVSATLWSSS